MFQAGKGQACFFRELMWPSRLRLLFSGPHTESPPESSISQLWVYRDTCQLVQAHFPSLLNQLSPATSGEGHCRVQAIHLSIPMPPSREW